MADEALQFTEWVQMQLSTLLGFPAGEELVNYILAFESTREMKEHFSNLLDRDDPKTKVFINEFFKKWQPRSSTSENALVYRKSEISSPTVKKKTRTKDKSQDEETFQVNFKKMDHVPNRIPERTFTTRPIKMVVDTTVAEFLDKNRLQPEEKQNMGKGSSPFKKKHLKFVPLYSADGKLKTNTEMLPGRHACQCLAQKHRLINNCIECGRIVCEQEGSGPCMFCGNLVCSIEEEDILSRKSKKSKKLMEKLLSQVAPEEAEEDKGLEAALIHKERLLEFDKNCTKRTKVIDDEADYFTSDNRWMTKKQKEALAKRDAELRVKRYASRRNKTYTIDFAGRKVEQTAEDNYVYDVDDSVVQSVTNINTMQRGGEVAPINSLLDPRITIPPPQFNSDGFKDNVTKFLKTQQEAVKNSLRLQDKELQEIVDRGMCLSMHQPWASLLVHGIKRLEGRSWYTAHRGRLWIASTSKPVDEETLRHLENQYRHFFPNETLVFPKDYPSAALLGCVTLVDCASNEEYFKKITLKEECFSLDEYKCSIKLLFTYMKNIHTNASVEKYRKLRISNEKFDRYIWQYESCRTLLLLAGFEQHDDFMILPSGTEISFFYTLLELELETIAPNELPSPTKTPEQSSAGAVGNLNLVGAAKGGSLFKEDTKSDLTLLSYLVEMGYSKVAAERGLIATGNKGVQPAMDWIDKHPECNSELLPKTTSTSDKINDASLMGIMETTKTEPVTSRLQKSAVEKHKFQEKLRLEAIKKSRLEKAEEKRAREYLKKNMASEKITNKEKFEREKNARHAKPDVKSPTSKEPDLNVSRIRIRSIDGNVTTWEGDKHTPVKEIYRYVTTLVTTSEDYQIVVRHPHHVLQPDDETLIKDIGLFPTGAIVVQKLRSGENIADPSREEIFQEAQTISDSSTAQESFNSPNQPDPPDSLNQSDCLEAQNTLDPPTTQSSLAVQQNLSDSSLPQNPSSESGDVEML